MSDITFRIDNKECTAKNGQTIVEAAKDNGVYIPVLCHCEGMKPAGACRLCTVRVGGRNMAACTTPVANGMSVENTSVDLEDMRKAIIEMLFVEGNHMCPTCEKSGNCELQALAYKYMMMVPRFPYQNPVRSIDAANPKIMIDHSRCIQCQRCVRAIKSSDGKNIFGFVNRGSETRIAIDHELAASMTDAMAQKAMDVCPVGCILKKENGFAIPIGKRKFDTTPIDSCTC